MTIQGKTQFEAVNSVFKAGFDLYYVPDRQQSILVCWIKYYTSDRWSFKPYPRIHQFKQLMSRVRVGVDPKLKGKIFVWWAFNQFLN